MTDTKSLYETDYALWLDRTVEHLTKQENDRVDWENLIEEIRSLGRSERKEIKSYLRQLFLHLLKRTYVTMPECYNGWGREIANFRLEIKQCLKESPSLHNYFNEIFTETFQEAASLLMQDKDYDRFTFPAECPFPREPDRLLNDTFWE